VTSRPSEHYIYVVVSVNKSDRRLAIGEVKVKGSPCSITERRVPELTPVLGSQSAGNVGH